MSLNSLKHIQKYPSEFREKLAEETTHRVGCIATPRTTLEACLREYVKVQRTNSSSFESLVLKSRVPAVPATPTVIS